MVAAILATKANRLKAPNAESPIPRRTTMPDRALVRQHRGRVAKMVGRAPHAE
jgi:hypothetical protein